MSTLRTLINYQRRQWEATILGLGGEYGQPAVRSASRMVARGRRMAKRRISNPQGRTPLRSKVRVFTWLPLRRQLLPIERDIQGPHVASLDHNLVLGLDGFFRRRGERVLHDRLA